MEFRTLTTVDEFRQVLALEQRVWGYTTAEDSVPVMMLLVSSRIGGLVIGAFDLRSSASPSVEGRPACVGFAYALPGVRDGKPYQWSHMLGVDSDYRDGGLGWRLKLEQRRLVMASGLDLIAWTFDPLQAANAHLNFAKLGTVAREYHRDAYPDSSSALHAGTATDRLVAEWWLRSARVTERLDPAAPEPRETQRTAAECWPRRRSSTACVKGTRGSSRRATTSRSTRRGLGVVDSDGLHRDAAARPAARAGTGGRRRARSSRRCWRAATWWWTSFSIDPRGAARTC